MKKFIIIFSLSCIASLVFSSTLKNTPYEEQLIKIQFASRLGIIADGLIDKPVEIQALLLDYADDEILLLKSRIALLDYPEKSEKVLLLYGAEPDFQKILRQYGEVVIPVVDYFYENEDALQEMIRMAQSQFLRWGEILRKIWPEQTVEPAQSQTPSMEKLTPLERGWYAVNFIADEGHDFLGQFSIGAGGAVSWIQTERILENLNTFFAGGIRRLEVKFARDETISATDLLWGVVDIAVIGGTLKLLRAGRAAAKTGKRLSFINRTRLFAPRLLAGAGFIARKMAKYGAAAATVYVVAAHPKLLHSMMAEVAEVAGFNPFLLQTTGWLFIGIIGLYPFFWIFKFLIRPIIWLLNRVIVLFRKVDIFLAPRPEMEYHQV